jgi:hypothetical protein
VEKTNEEGKILSVLSVFSCEESSLEIVAHGPPVRGLRIPLLTERLRDWDRGVAQTQNKHRKPVSFR